MRKILIALVGVLGLVAGGATVMTSITSASANVSADHGCKFPSRVECEPHHCVPKDAWTEYTGWVLKAPRAGWYQVDERVVIDKEAYDEVIPGTAEVWANFSPTKPKTFVGPPNWPSDARGKWNVHDQIPPGHAGPDGVYSKGNPNKGGNWFYRHAGTAEQVIHHEAETHKEFKFAFDHAAITCPTTPTEEPCPTDYNGDQDGCGTPPVEQCEPEDYNGDEEGCGVPPTDTPTTPTDTPSTPTDTPSVPTQTPTTPETEDAPPVTVENNCSATKCVKITKDSSGKTIDKQVVKYEADVKEEGF